MTNHEFIADRRRFLALGGVAGAALLAACGSDKAATTSESTTTTSVRSAQDIARLQTASALEELEVAIYQRGLDTGIVKTPAIVDAVKALQAQHKSHAGLFEGHTTRLGGEPATSPNPALLQQFQSRLTDEVSLLRAAFDVAQIAAATYQAAAGNLSDKSLNVIFMSVCGVEARHAALIGTFINQPVPAASLATTDKALK